MNELSRTGQKGDQLQLEYKGKPINAQSPRFDIIEPRKAEILARINSLDKGYPIITKNKYGKGYAIYIGLPADKAILNPVISDLVHSLNLKMGPDVPEGIMARQIDPKHVLYLNTGKQAVRIRLKGVAKGILTGKTFMDGFTLPAEEPELVETR